MMGTQQVERRVEHETALDEETKEADGEAVFVENAATINNVVQQLSTVVAGMRPVMGNDDDEFQRPEDDESTEDQQPELESKRASRTAGSVESASRTMVDSSDFTAMTTVLQQLAAVVARLQPAHQDAELGEPDQDCQVSAGNDAMGERDEAERDEREQDAGDNQDV
ncbi:hypothetical protein GN244_ATG19202 [Phytophthora infestans]|uniref:Uncharacterized protein n=1 Tax=Phytophthora infestans TaxID=4787 RepID=A0A833SEH8_PHYIN|nr:hypothetical protein GN244_ATG19202 [Phytophthora infestans]